jgi:hypothetical protein
LRFSAEEFITMLRNASLTSDANLGAAASGRC